MSPAPLPASTTAVADALSLPTIAGTEELEAMWMPYSFNRDFKARPRLLASAKGMFYRDAAGREVLDACSGLWCVNAGHCREEIAQAIARQAGELDYAPSFQMGHPVAFAFASRLARLAPGALDHVFFTNSGSESVDTALKVALAYHAARGEPERVRFVGRQRGFHGVGFGGTSVGGMENNRRAFQAGLLPQVDHLPHTWNLEHQAFSRGMPSWGAHLADDLERIVAERGAHTIAAVIVEPMAGSTGVLIPPKGYLERLRAICDRHGLLLIFDEVITGFGRLGAPFASQYFGVEPDMMTIAKGMTNGAVPMGACLVNHRLYRTITEATPWGIEFFHGYTYSGHPLAAAAGMATLDIHEREGLLTRAGTLAAQWEEAIHSLRGIPTVIDIRNLGLVGAVEMAPRDGEPGRRGYEALRGCFEAGMLVRVTGDTVALAPPLIASPAELDRMVETLARVLRGIA